MVLSMLIEFHDCLIITSVLAGDKKFKTISFHHKWLKPLTFEKEMPLTEFRRHRTLRPPKFDIDINIPIKLPLEEEYPQEEYKKPVTSDVSFKTYEIKEPSYSYSVKSEPAPPKDLYSASTNTMNYAAVQNPQKRALPETGKVSNTVGQAQQSTSNSRSDNDVQQNLQVDSSNVYRSSKGYNNNYQYGNYQTPEFIPGGFVNLQLSGPTGGPKMTYEDYDREKWAQQLSQTPGAMPYPILNYQQLQNFYGGLGTFTNGLPENRYEHTSLLDILKSKVDLISQKLHLG